MILLERPLLRASPAKDYACCVNKPIALPPYSQVEFASNRYSVPADKCVLAEQAGSLHQPVLSSHHVAQVSG